MSRLIRVSSSEGEESYRYDALGRMTEKTDREGLQTQYAYTPDGKTQGILYGDGRKVELSYTHLRELSMVKDWMGETRIKRNQQANPVQITNHAGRTVTYEWGAFGERTGMVYPDGTALSYRYDKQLCLTELNLYNKENEELLRESYNNRVKPKGKLTFRWENGVFMVIVKILI